MLATIIVNHFGLSDTSALAEALEELCSPNDTYGWSSSGIYCFWNIETKEVLYIGLAIDLPLRFQQHNGLSTCAENCCKRAQIATHFQSNSRLGFSVFVQSPISQAISHRWEDSHPGEMELIVENFGYLDHAEAKEDLNRKIVNELRKAESGLLAAHRIDHGNFPIWNEIGGAVLKLPESKLEYTRYILRSLTRAHSIYDPLMARCTLEEMSGAGNSIKERYEIYLHAARMHVLAFQTSLSDALKIIPDVSGDLTRIKTENYLNKQPAW